MTNHDWVLHVIADMIRRLEKFRYEMPPDTEKYRVRAQELAERLSQAIKEK